MVSKEQEILQIRKYLNGELNAKAMHELERRALDDPFLMDALEGFEHANDDQQPALDELNDRLHQRTAKRERRIISWVPLSAAASIVIVLGGGIWFFTGRHKSEKKVLVADEMITQKKRLPAASAPALKDTISVQNNGYMAKMAPVAQPKVNVDKKTTADAPQAQQYAAPTVQQHRAAETSTIAAGYTAPASPDPYADLYKPKKDSLGNNELIVKEMEAKKKGNSAAAAAQSSSQTLLNSKVDGVTVTTEDSHTITGTVMGSDGFPIPGAVVKVAGRNFGVVTDVNGRFILPDVPKNQTLSVNYIGYSSKKVRADKDSMRINLEPVSSSLGEVVVTKTMDKDVETGDAHPRDGWKKFDNYLKMNAQVPNGQTGKVRVSFNVAADGTLSQFKIVKSLNDAADKKAIDLISNGPQWVGGKDGKVKEITVSIKFD